MKYYGEHDFLDSTVDGGDLRPIEIIGPRAGDVNIDLSSGKNYILYTNGAFAINPSGLGAKSLSTTVMIISDAQVNISFYGDMKWLGSKPSVVPALSSGVLSMQSFAPLGSGVIAGYDLLGNG